MIGGCFDGALNHFFGAAASAEECLVDLLGFGSEVDRLRCEDIGVPVFVVSRKCAEDGRSVRFSDICKLTELTRFKEGREDDEISAFRFGEAANLFFEDAVTQGVLCTLFFDECGLQLLDCRDDFALLCGEEI